MEQTLKLAPSRSLIKNPLLRLTAAASAVTLLLASCMTTYDAHGRPVQSVDPGAVAVGALVLGTAAYAAGRNNGKSKHHRSSHHRGHYDGYHGGYYGGGHRPHHGYRRHR